MTDTNAAEPVFSIQRMYLKDLSLELPNAPLIFTQSEAPSVEIGMDVGVEALDATLYEVTVTATVTTRVKDQVAFLIEAKQAGIFECRHMPPEQLDPVLGIVCPGIVYPYLRATIADVITRASFPPIHLAEINFQAFYEQRLSQLQADGGTADPANSVTTDTSDSGLILPPGVQRTH